MPNRSVLISDLLLLVGCVLQGGPLYASEDNMAPNSGARWISYKNTILEWAVQNRIVSDPLRRVPNG